MFAVYALYDPRTDELFYVGKTVTSLAERLGSHCAHSRYIDYRGRQRAIQTRVAEICERGDVPKIVPLEIFPNDEDDADAEDALRLAEKQWILMMQRAGHRLANTRIPRKVKLL